MKPTRSRSLVQILTAAGTICVLSSFAYSQVTQSDAAKRLVPDTTATPAAFEPTTKPATPTGMASPSFIAIGGALEDENSAIFEAMLTRKDTNKIVIVPYASADAAEAGKRTIERFKKYRPDARYVVLPDPAKDEASRDLAISWISHADLVFFTGGDQKRLNARFGSFEKPNGVLNALNQGMRRWDTRVAGTSAGAAMMSDPMFLGGGSESALAGTPAIDGEDADPGAIPGDAKPPVGVRLGPGLGLVPNVIIDTHFFPRGRIGRLIAAVDNQKTRVGVGIDEDRAVRFDANGTTAMGNHAALLVHGTIIREGLSRLGARLTLVSEGDNVKLKGWIAPGGSPGAGIAVEFTAAHNSVPLDAAARLAIGAFADAQDARYKERARYEPDAWGRDRALQVLRRLAAEPVTPQHATSDQFELVISADEYTQFYWDGKDPATLRLHQAIADVRERLDTKPETEEKNVE